MGNCFNKLMRSTWVFTRVFLCLGLSTFTHFFDIPLMLFGIFKYIPTFTP